MNTITKLFSAFLLLAFAAMLVPSTFAADSARIQATLILGSNEGGGVDSHLRKYERNLKRVLPFDTFKQQGSGSAQIAVPGNGSVSIGGGHQVSLSVADAGGKLRITAKWTKGNRTYINTTVVTAPNQPTVLGGPSEGQGKLILLLVAQ